MSASAQLTFHRIGVNHPSGTDRAVAASAGKPEPTSTPYLSLFTASGRPRDVELSEDELVKLVAQAARALAILRGVNVPI